MNFSKKLSEYGINAEFINIEKEFAKIKFYLCSAGDSLSFNVSTKPEVQRQNSFGDGGYLIDYPAIPVHLNGSKTCKKVICKCDCVNTDSVELFIHLHKPINKRIKIKISNNNSFQPIVLFDSIEEVNNNETIN